MLESFSKDKNWKRKVDFAFRLKRAAQAKPKYSSRVSDSEHVRERLQELAYKMKQGRITPQQLAKLLASMEQGASLGSRDKKRIKELSLRGIPVRTAADMRNLKGIVQNGYLERRDQKFVTEHLDVSGLDLRTVTLHSPWWKIFRRIDYLRNAFVYAGDVRIKTSEGGQDTNTCSYCEESNRNVLGISNLHWHRRAGMLLYLDGRPVGFVKMDGVQSFLAMRTVRDKAGKNILVKGMVYAIETHVRKAIEALFGRHQDHTNRYGYDQWVGVDLEDVFAAGLKHPQPHRTINVRNQRWVTDPEIIRALDQLTGEIESGKEAVTKLQYAEPDDEQLLR